MTTKPKDLDLDELQAKLAIVDDALACECGQYFCSRCAGDQEIAPLIRTALPRLIEMVRKRDAELAELREMRRRSRSGSRSGSGSGLS